MDEQGQCSMQILLNITSHELHQWDWRILINHVTVYMCLCCPIYTVIVQSSRFELLGIRGQLHVIVKVDLFTDSNKFRQSSCGVRFFCSKCWFMFKTLSSLYCLLMQPGVPLSVSDISDMMANVVTCSVITWTLQCTCWCGCSFELWCKISSSLWSLLLLVL